ncbi:hypothetical protein ACFV3R_21855 [Streptomyces sp. NPDC059740]|uniref:hypothetical protein n=1 Tax=Streptomyces sp. NPDC059740 TaxID=3346926 RepID=UPI00365B29D6
MKSFTADILQRIRNTEADLDQALASGDDHLVEVELGELEDLRRLATEHGVAVTA